MEGSERDSLDQSAPFDVKFQYEQAADEYPERKDTIIIPNNYKTFQSIYKEIPVVKVPLIEGSFGIV